MYHEILSTMQKFRPSYLEEARFNSFEEFGGNQRFASSEMEAGHCQKCHLQSQKRHVTDTSFIRPLSHRQQTGDASIAAVRRSYAIENESNLFGATTLYAVPVEHETVLSSSAAFKPQCEVHRNSHQVNQNTIHSSLNYFQDAAIDLSSSSKPQDEVKTEASSRETLNSLKKGTSKTKGLRKSLSYGKWKRAYLKGVIRKTKIDEETLMLIGPNGPVLYKKVAGALPMSDLKISNQEAAVEDEAEKGAGDAPSSSAVETAAADVTETLSREEDTREPSSSAKLCGGEGKGDALPYGEGAAAENKDGESQVAYQQKTIHDDSTHSWVELKRQAPQTKQIYRAKNDNAYSRMSSCSSRTCATDNEDSNKRGDKGNDKLRILKDAMPSLVAKSKSDHLKQLKECIVSYVDYLGMKSDLEAGVTPLSLPSNIQSDASTTQIGSSKLIDMVSNSKPVQRLPSEVTLSVTESVTDALVSADEPDRDTKIPKKLKKLREKQFEKFQKEVDGLFAMMRCIDTIAAFPK